jgi:hypothetical protein
MSWEIVDEFVNTAPDSIGRLDEFVNTAPDLIRQVDE